MASQEAFGGRIGVTYRVSEPDWSPDASPVDAPNVLLILLGRHGFGNLGCYGSTIETPNMDALASNGLRYNNFHVTPLCPPRGHACSPAATTMPSASRPSLRKATPASQPAGPDQPSRGNAGGDAERGRLRHLRPRQVASQPNAHGSRRTARRVAVAARFRSLLRVPVGGDSPVRSGPHLRQPPGDPSPPPAEGYHLTEDLVDHAIEFVNDLRPSGRKRPFHVLRDRRHALPAPGAKGIHRQVPRPFRRRLGCASRAVLRATDRTRDHSPRHPPPAEQSRRADLESLKRERAEVRVPATGGMGGFLEHTDVQLGRLIDHLRVTGHLDNTVVILTADNGTSQNGGPYGVMNAGASARRNAANDGQTVGAKLGRPEPEEDFDAIQEKLEDIGGPTATATLPGVGRRSGTRRSAGTSRTPTAAACGCP